jgi:hypothetical protein
MTSLAALYGSNQLVEDTTPQLGGDLDINSHGIKFSTPATLTDCIDDDTMAAAADTKLATSESIKAYADTKMADLSDDTTPSLGGTFTIGEFAIQLDASLSADGKYSGITCDGVIGYASGAFGDLVYLALADDRWEKTDANAVGTAGDVMLGLVISTGASDGDACVILLFGFIKETDFNFPNGGDALYVSETAGEMTATAPSTASVMVRVVGYAGVDADTVFFNPSKSWLQVAA